MQTMNKYALIQIDHLLIEDRVGHIMLAIRPGAYCVFDEAIPSNARHFHHCYELCIVTDGNGMLIHDDKTIPIKKGDVFITDPKQWHEITVATDPVTRNKSTLNLFFFLINLYDCDAKSISQEKEEIVDHFLEKHVVLRKSQQQLFSYLSFLYDYSRHKENNYSNKAISFGLEQAIKDVVYSSLLTLTEQTKPTHSKSENTNNIIDKAQDYICLHLSQKITLEKLATHCNTSKRNLQRLFMQYLHTTVVDYVNKRRMSLACSYLRMNFRIGDIGPHVGIEDPAQFCRVFKKYYGSSPKKYQTMHASNGMMFGADFK